LPEKTETASGPGAEGRTRPPRGRLRGRRLLYVVDAVLAVVVVAALVATVVLGLKVHQNGQQDQDRAAAASVAQQFALRMDDVNGADFAKYIKNVNALLTTKAKSKNSQVLDAMKQTYAAAKVKGSGKVLMTAVGDYDPDSATVLVVHDASVTTSQGQLEHHYRWSVQMVKVHDRWLVDDFNPVN
jgi:hypothetical protein